VAKTQGRAAAGAFATIPLNIHIFFGNPANFSYRTGLYLESDVLESAVQKRILMSVFFGIWRLFSNRTFCAARPGARQHRADLPPHAQALTTAHPCVFDILWWLLMHPCL